MNIIPVQFMRGLAAGALPDVADVYRTNGYGWEHFGRTHVAIVHPGNRPLPSDPQDATTAELEVVQINFGRDYPIRIGDRVLARGRRWIIGSINDTATNGALQTARAGRPTAATPRIWLTLRRWNTALAKHQAISPQLVQLAWSSYQPTEANALSIRQGYIFAPEEDMSDLDVQQGDTFPYLGSVAKVEWVSPEPTERREATFSIPVGTGA